MLKKYVLVISGYFEPRKRKDSLIMLCFFCTCPISCCTKSLNFLVASAEC